MNIRASIILGFSLMASIFVHSYYKGESNRLQMINNGENTYIIDQKNLSIYLCNGKKCRSLYHLPDQSILSSNPSSFKKNKSKYEGHYDQKAQHTPSFDENSEGPLNEETPNQQRNMVDNHNDSNPHQQLTENVKSPANKEMRGNPGEEGEKKEYPGQAMPQQSSIIEFGKAINADNKNNRDGVEPQVFNQNDPKSETVANGENKNNGGHE